MSRLAVRTEDAANSIRDFGDYLDRHPEAKARVTKALDNLDEVLSEIEEEVEAEFEEENLDEDEDDNDD